MECPILETVPILDTSIHIWTLVSIIIHPIPLNPHLKPQPNGNAIGHFPPFQLRQPLCPGGLGLVAQLTLRLIDTDKDVLVWVRKQPLFDLAAGWKQGGFIDDKLDGGQAALSCRVVAVAHIEQTLTKALLLALGAVHPWGESFAAFHRHAPCDFHWLKYPIWRCD
jgi:hypothetical protein